MSKCVKEFFYLYFKLFINLLSIVKCYTLSNAYEMSLGRNSLVTVKCKLIYYLSLILSFLSSSSNRFQKQLI